MKSEMLSKIINDLVKSYTTNNEKIDATNMKLPIDLGELKPDRQYALQATNTYIIDGEKYVFYLIVRKDNHVILANITE